MRYDLDFIDLEQKTLKRLWPASAGAWLEFDVESVERSTAELESRGYRMLVKNKKEPWGQTVSRFLAPEGLLVGITFTPWMREKSGATSGKLADVGRNLPLRIRSQRLRWVLSGLKCLRIILIGSGLHFPQACSAPGC